MCIVVSVWYCLMYPMEKALYKSKYYYYYYYYYCLMCAALLQYLAALHVRLLFLNPLFDFDLPDSECAPSRLLF